MARSGLTRLAMIAVMLLPTAAHAQVGLVEGEMQGCPEDARRAFEQILPVELQTLESSTRERIEAATPHVRVTCDEEGALVRVESEGDGRAVEERIDAEQVARPGFGRRAALTVVELLSVLTLPRVQRRENVEPEPTPIPEPEPAPVQEPEAPDPAPAAVRPPWVHLSLGGRVRGGGDPLLASGGAGIAADVDVLPWLSVGADAEVLYTEPRIALGTVATTLVSGSLRALAGPDVAWLGLRFGAGYRLGAVVFEGRADAPDVAAQSASLGWSGPFALVLLRGRWEALELAVGAEAGWVVESARATVNRTVALTLGGAWVTAHLAVGVAL